MNEKGKAMTSLFCILSLFPMEAAIQSLTDESRKPETTGPGPSGQQGHWRRLSGVTAWSPAKHGTRWY
jgi:hypothetical protein